MLVGIDASHLDWTAAVFLSQDPVGMEEIIREYDIHSDNEKTFVLPSRLIAKKFLFRIIFGGTEYSFAVDPEFAECRMSVKQWSKVIEKFYSKYKGMAAWHESLIRQASTTGSLSIPTGRSWSFAPAKNKRGELEWPITQIKNYPVQGLEADLMMIARISFFNRIKHDKRILLVNSVHDSILVDVPNVLVDWTVQTLYSVFNDLPSNFKRLFGVEFNLPYRGKVVVGMDWLNMEEV